MTILKIQPGPGDTYDSFVDEDNPNSNYKDAVTLIIGGDVPNRKQSLVQFDLSGIPAGVTITKAEFAVYCLIADGDPDIKCHEVSQVWYLDTVDWNERPIPGFPGIAGVLSQGNWTKFDVRSIVLDWIENPEYNLGFQIIADLCADSYNTLASGDYLDNADLRPYLEITYTGGAGGAGGILLQHKYTETVAKSYISTVIPYDDTIPQKTEGTELLTLAITPFSATHRLVVEAVINVGSYYPAYASIAALFQDAIADALATGSSFQWAAVSYVGDIIIVRYEGVAGTTSEITFKLRIGTADASRPITVNGHGNQRYFGGTMRTSLRISEISV